MPTITLFPRPPFDFSLTAAIFSTGDPEIRVFNNSVFTQVLDTEDGLALAEVRSAGSVEEPALDLTLHAEGRMRSTGRKKAEELVKTIFNTTDNLDPFYRAVLSDPVLSALTVRLRGVRAPSTPTVFEALTDSIIEQQISLAAARSVENRLIKAVGEHLVTGGSVYYAYPGPAALALTSDAVFRNCGLTLRKGEYIRDLSGLILRGDFDPEGLRTYSSTEEIIDELIKIRGIGRWTAELAILRGLHRPDAFPADDVGVRRFIAHYYRAGMKISPAEARVFAERWGAWKGFAAYYLEVADLLGIRPGV